MQVLFADDNPEDALLMRRACDKAGFGNLLVHVSSGEQAIAFLRDCGQRSDLPTIVILDINMPRVDGFEVLEWIRAQPAVSRVPVIILTSSVLEADTFRATLLGANEFLVKPSSFDELVSLAGRIRANWLPVAQ